MAFPVFNKNVNSYLFYINEKVPAFQVKSDALFSST